MGDNNQKYQKKDKIADPFAEMTRTSKYRAAKLAEEQVVEVEEEQADELIEDDLLFPIPSETVDCSWAVKRIGIISGGAVLAVLLVFLFLFTYPLGLSVTDAEFIERYNGLILDEENMIQSAYESLSPVSPSVISGSDLLGTAENPTMTSTPGFYVSAERSGGKIYSITIGSEDNGGYDFSENRFKDADSYYAYFMHLWRGFSAIDPYYSDFMATAALLNTISEANLAGDYYVRDNGYVFVFSFRQQLYVKVYPGREHIAQFGEFIPPEPVYNEESNDIVTSGSDIASPTDLDASAAVSPDSVSSAEVQ